MYARIMVFSNGDLISLYDRSDGFFRRQMILTTKLKSPDREDDPHLAEKLCDELEGIFLWAFAGLQRLVKNNFQFTDSNRGRMYRDIVKRDASNVALFLESEGYIRRDEGLPISSKNFANIYRTWCDENAYPPMKDKTVIEFTVANQKKFGIEYTNNVINMAGRRVRGFKGIGAVFRPPGTGYSGWQVVGPDDNSFKNA